jgi:hypothetical protein
MTKTVFDKIHENYRRNSFPFPTTNLIKDALFSPFESARGFSQHFFSTFITYPAWQTLAFSLIFFAGLYSGLSALYYLSDNHLRNKHFDEFILSLFGFIPLMLAIPLVPLALILAIPVRGAHSMYVGGKHLFFGGDLGADKVESLDMRTLPNLGG